eukprot:339377-Heterocapsa_arctica.AAC.1
MVFKTGINPKELCLRVVHEAAFDNLPQHNLYLVHCLGWQSSRIQRAVRSTLAAEAYSSPDAIDTLDWARA